MEIYVRIVWALIELETKATDLSSEENYILLLNNDTSDFLLYILHSGV